MVYDGETFVLSCKKRTLLAIAGCVWLLAGYNVARLGILAYGCLHAISAVHILRSAAVFCAFGRMFFKMSVKHAKRIKGYAEEWRPAWHFFDGKAYLIMAFMMGGGIGLRYSGLLPEVFIRRVLYGPRLCISLGRPAFLASLLPLSGGWGKCR